MNNQTYWKQKIIALFHDPVFKATRIKTHKQLSASHLECLNLKSDWEVKSADHIASGMDRVSLPFEINNNQNRAFVEFEELNHFLHPLSGHKLTAMEYVKSFYLKNFHEENQQFERWLRELRETYGDDWERTFHHLWWSLPSRVRMGGFLPADTRVPYHSIIDHLDMTATMEGCRDHGHIRPAFLQIASGPVQKFIAAARKTKDLWIGSYLLSMITFQAIRHIGQEFGFDHILFPNMRHQTLLKDFLRSQEVFVEDEDFDLPKEIASLPNRFLALVPASQAQRIAQEAERAVRSYWKDLSDRAKATFNLDTEQSRYWDLQIDTFPEFYYAIQESVEPKELSELYRTYFEDDMETQEYVAQLQIIEKNDGYTPNSGSIYAYLFELARRKLEAVKSTTAFRGYVDPRMMDGDDLSGEMKAIVSDYREGQSERTERLNAISLIKRKVEAIEKSVPSRKVLSTSHIAIRNLPKDEWEEWDQKVEKQDLPGNVDKRLLDNLPNSYYAILMMDGDKMGKWVSGENAPELKDRFHAKTIEAIEKLQKKEKDFHIEALKKSAITPSYHRAVSRTLDAFSSFMKPVVEGTFNGMLIYAGGDDVLAFVPAVHALACVNLIRKVYSGIGGVEVLRKGKTYRFEEETCWFVDNGEKIPQCTMMGIKATMSAGIVILNHKFPLSDGLDLARAAEKSAKEKGRNGFCITTVRHSGQQTQTHCKWEVGEQEILCKAEKAWKIFEETKASRKLIYAFQEYGRNGSRDRLDLTSEEWHDRLIPYLVDKRGEVNDKGKERLICHFQEAWKQLGEEGFQTYLEILLSYEFTSRKGDKQ